LQVYSTGNKQFKGVQKAQKNTNTLYLTKSCAALQGRSLRSYLS